MSQISVADEPVQAYEGRVQEGGQFPNQIITKLASALTYFGKLVVPHTANSELEIGGASGGPQRIKAPTTAAEVLRVLQGGGIAIADPSVERLRDANGDPAPYGAYKAESAVPVLRKGRVWVVVNTAVTNLDTDGVFVRVNTPGGTPPTDALGSFTTVNGVEYEPAPAGFAWQGAASVGGINYGLLAVNLP